MNTVSDHNISGFNYSDVSQTVELLAQTPLGEKNMIFGYANKTMKEWATLKKYMEGNSLNLLSVAKFIEQSLRFDLYLMYDSVLPSINQLKRWITNWLL